MTTKIILKKSGSTATVPTPAQLDLGELALNYADGILFYKDSNNIVQSISGGGGGTYSNANVDLHLNTASASANQILSWNGTDYSWVNDATGSGGASSLTRTEVIATQDQTRFNVSHTVGPNGSIVGFIYLNGVLLLAGDDYLATNGLYFDLTNGADTGDIIEVFTFNVASVQEGALAASNNLSDVNDAGIALSNLDANLASFVNTFTLPVSDGVANQAVTTDGAGNLSFISYDLSDFTDNTNLIPSLTGYATETYVDTAVSNVIDSAPGVLDTLNELAQALGDDANFSTTITNSLSLKANTADLNNVATSGLYSDLTGTPTIPTSITDLGISDGAPANILVTDGSGTFTFSAPPVSLPDQTGSSGYFLTTDGSTASWIPSVAGQHVYSRYTYTASNGQTAFSAVYDVGYVDVYLNGLKLSLGVDFTASSGTGIILSTGANTDDIVEIIAHQVYNNVVDVVQLRRDTALGWTNSNPVLLVGELGVESDTDKIKIGDGSSNWNSLNYLIDTNGYLLATNNLSDISDTAAALTNLGVTATAAELNYTSGVTSDIQTQLDAKGTVSALSDLGVTSTSTELNYTSGVTSDIQTQFSAIQTQLDAKGTVSTLSDLSVTATSTELNYVSGVTSSIQTQLDTKGTVSALSDLGVTATSTELNYNSGVTNPIQTQLDAKASTGKAIAMAMVFGG